MTHSLLIYNAHLLDESMDTPGALLILDKEIRAVFQGYYTNSKTVEEMARLVLKEDGFDSSVSIELYDANGLTVTPAFIDMHVHLRYPGLTQKEDLNSGLHAAASGGFGTVVAMPNTKPVVSSIELAKQIEMEGSALGLTHLFQVVSITKDFEGKDTAHLDMLEKQYVPVISEDGHDVLSSAVMLEGMKKAAAKGIIVSCHCEDVSLCEMAKPYRQHALQLMKENNISASNFALLDEPVPEVLPEIDENLAEANSLLALAEDSATVRNIMLAQKAGCHIHLAHVSTENCMEAIRYAKEEAAYYKNGFAVTCEVTPHHIALEGETEPNIRALVNPPLRPEQDRIALIEAIKDGTVDVISTDHAPHTADDKAAGSPGFTGIELSYAVCNTVLVKQEGISSRRLSQLMSANPGRILGLNKGLLKTGYDADITLIDSEESWVVDSSQFYSKGKSTPFNGKKVTGKVHGLIIDGRKVLER